VVVWGWVDLIWVGGVGCVGWMCRLVVDVCWIE